VRVDVIADLGTQKKISVTGNTVNQIVKDIVLPVGAGIVYGPPLEHNQVDILFLRCPMILLPQLVVVAAFQVGKNGADGFSVHADNLALSLD
jgi:hypothetical protein